MFKTPYGSILVLACLLLLFACGADETVNTPFAENSGTDVVPAPASSPYYPIALGNRWTYRNPDGSEWSRHVDESEILDAERYHSFSYKPAVKLESLGTVEYVTYADRFVRTMNLSEINDVVWEVIPFL